MHFRQYQIPGCIEFGAGLGGLPRARIQTPWSRAEIYLQGAQVTAFQRHDEPPLLFLSQRSQFVPGKAIRGGVPICYPWFGPRPGEVSHGFARITEWEVLESVRLDSGAARLRFKLPVGSAANSWSELAAELIVTVAQDLALELIVTNRSSQRPLEFENCFHTYFAVGDVGRIAIRGLQATEFRDKLRKDAVHTQRADPLTIRAQTDRTYRHATPPVEIDDPMLLRQIRVEKTGSASTVVWNPWTTQVLADLGPEEFRRMVCVESGNVEEEHVHLAPGQSSRLEVRISSQF